MPQYHSTSTVGHYTATAVDVFWTRHIPLYQQPLVLPDQPQE